MLIIYSCLNTAIAKIPVELSDVRKTLQSASIEAQKYYALSNSIYWIDAKAWEKRKIKQELAVIAFNSYSYFLHGYRLLQASNADLSEKKEATISLNLSYYEYQKHHSHEIYAKQLCLID
jgi:hypothetical protein